MIEAYRIIVNEQNFAGIACLIPGLGGYTPCTTNLKSGFVCIFPEFFPPDYYSPSC
jgi:hypothetical protein